MSKDTPDSESYAGRARRYDSGGTGATASRRNGSARTGGQILREGFGELHQVRHKGEVDIVTETDLRSEKAIAEILRGAFPHHRILAEEGSVGGDDQRHRWLVDPLDGTTNYADGLPFFCVSIAYEQDDQVELGIIFDPLRDEMFLAQRGSGVFLNDRALTVSTTDTLIQSLVATGFPYDRDNLPRALRQFSQLSARAQAVRRLGSAALDLAYVAAGRFDCYWEAIIQPWDVAAGVLMVEEAGSVVTDLAGAPFRLGQGEILSSNGFIHQAMLAELASTSAP